MKNLLSLFCFSFMTLLSVGSVSAQHGWTSSSTAKNDTEALRSSAMATESDCAALRYQALNLGLYTVDISNYQWFNTNLNTPAGLAYLATKQAQQATRIAACNTLYDAFVCN